MNTHIQQSAHLTNVQVSTPARLHLGFLDLNGSIGRKFGSFGLAIDSHHTTVELSSANEAIITSPSPQIDEKVTTAVTQFYKTVGTNINPEKTPVSVNIKQAIPSHSGFGSGTQLSLAVGSALARFHSINISTQQLANALGRGRRSGIGIASFDQGGFIVDGGNKPDTNMPPLLLRQPFPEEWRIVLILDHSNTGIHGQEELAAFKTLPLFPKENAERICHMTLMQLLPALVEQDIDNFGQAITSIQSLIGDHFAAAQGGRYTSESVATLLKYSQSLGFSGIAQSSWGPTGCIFAENETQAQQLVEKLRQQSEKAALNQHNLEILVAKANNTGAIIEPSYLNK